MGSSDKLQTEVIEEVGFLVPSLLVVGVLFYLGPCVCISKQSVVVDVEEVCSSTMWSKNHMADCQDGSPSHLAHLSPSGYHV